MNVRNGLQALVCALILCAALSDPRAVAAESYRLVAGDRVSLAHAGLPEPKSFLVDADGAVRLIDVGGVPVAGQTLDEAADRIAAALSDAGLYVAPRVSISIDAYAPVVVAGDVLAPGGVTYVPGLTVEGAIALAGGGQLGGLSRSEIARARAETESGLRIANLEIAASLVEWARHRAALADHVPELSAAERAMVPAPDPADLDTALAGETARLETERARRDDLLAFWSDEIDTIADQIALFEQRIAVQDRIVASTVEALENARALQERGMQTMQRLATAEQRAGDAQSRALELQSARISAMRAIADAERARVDFLADWDAAAQAGMQSARLTLDTARARYDRFALQAALLSGPRGLVSDSVVFRYLRRSGRDPSTPPVEVAGNEPLWPGDVLTVHAEPIGSDPEG